MRTMPNTLSKLGFAMAAAGERCSKSRSFLRFAHPAPGRLWLFSAINDTGAV